MPAQNKLKFNTLLNISGGLGSILILLVTTPFLVKMLGLEAFGILSIIWIVLNVASSLDFGIGRALAFHIASNSKNEQNFGGVVAISFAFTFLLGSGLGTLFILFNKYFSTTFLTGLSESGPQPVDLLLLVGVAIPFSITNTVLSLALDGRRRFVSANIFLVVSTACIQGGPVILHYLGIVETAHEVIAASILLRMLAPILLVLFLLADPKTRHWERTPISALIPLIYFGGKVQVSSLSGLFIENIDKLLLSSMIGPAALAIYNIPFQINGKIKLFSVALTRSVIPEVAAARGREQEQQLAEHAFRILVRAITPVLILFVVLYSDLMQLWLGASEGSAVSKVGFLLLFGLWFNLVADLPSAVLQGTGRPGAIAVIQIGETLPFLGVLLLAINFLGVQGAALAWVTRATLDCAILAFVSGVNRHMLTFALPHFLSFLSIWLLALVLEDFGPTTILGLVPFLAALIYLSFSVYSLRAVFPSAKK